MADPSLLRRRYLEDLQLAGLSKRTQEAYVRAVRQLGEYFEMSRTSSPTSSCATTSSTS